MLSGAPCPRVAVTMPTGSGCHVKGSYLFKHQSQQFQFPESKFDATPPVIPALATPMVADGGAEKIIRKRCKEWEGEKFEYSGDTYKMIKCSKPSGEQKTDFFIVAKNISDGKEKTFKVSYKKSTYAFVENKIRRYRIKELFGHDWRNVVQTQTGTISSKFKKRPLIEKRKAKITLGWRYEIESLHAVKSNRTLSVPIEQDIASHILWAKLAGASRRDAKVDGVTIPGSGQPDYILIADPEELATCQEFFNKLEDIKKYADEHGKMRVAFITHNYRWDGEMWVTESKARDFPVWVNWRVAGGLLEGQVVLDQPFDKKSGGILCDLEKCLDEMGIPMDSKLMENLGSRISGSTASK